MKAVLQKPRVATLLRLLPLAPLVLVGVFMAPGPHEPSLRATAVTGNVKLVNSRAGGAIVSAAHMDPGDSVSGTVTLENSGDAPAALELSKSHLVDMPGVGGGRLSQALFLAVDDLSAGRRVYEGPLASMITFPMDPIPAGGHRSFRFIATLPRTRGDAYQVAYTSVRFDWSADALPKPPNPAPPDTRAPRLVLSGKRRQLIDRRGLLVRARCDEPCTLRASASVYRVRGLRRGRVTPAATAASARRRVAIRVRFSRRARSRLWHAARRGRVVVTVTARDRAGNRTVARRRIRLRRAPRPGPSGAYLVGQRYRAAVDRPVGAGDVRGALGAEERDHGGDLVVSPEAP